MPLEHYEAAICRRGHKIDAMIEPRKTRLEPVPERCEECGAKVLLACPNTNCGARLHGYIIGSFPGRDPWKPADFCYNCGQPYPWASRESIAYHIENMLEEDASLSEGDRRALREQLDSLRESPADPAAERRQVAALNFMRKAAPTVWHAAVPVLQAITTAEMRRQLGLPPA
jgi:hypothetical protein